MLRGDAVAWASLVLRSWISNGFDQIFAAPGKRVEPWKSTMEPALVPGEYVQGASAEAVYILTESILGGEGYDLQMDDAIYAREVLWSWKANGFNTVRAEPKKPVEPWYADEVGLAKEDQGPFFPINSETDVAALNEEAVKALVDSIGRGDRYQLM